MTALLVPDKATPLQVLDLIGRIRSALSKVEAPAEAAQIIKQADAIKYLAQKAEASQAVQQQAAKVAILSRQRAGELLTAMPKHPAGRPEKNRSHDTTDLPPTLKDLDITRDDSSRWQKLATVPRDELEKHIDTVIEEGGEPTTAETLRYVEEREEARQREKDRAEEKETVRRIVQRPEFDHIVKEALATVSGWLEDCKEIGLIPSERFAPEARAFMARRLGKAIVEITKLQEGFK